jgi:hypothetical protein
MVSSWSGEAGKRMVAFVTLGVLAIVGVAAWLSLRGPNLESARDYEECIEALGGSASPGQSAGDARGNALTNCNARFAGRRKVAGGYSYYDFMQGRSFDIAGPNPTAEERRRIDNAYIEFLDSQRQESVSAELARRQDEQLRTEIESPRQPIGPPLMLTPKTAPSQAARPPADRSKPARCDDNSLACGWSRLSAAVKNAFASSSKAKP